MFKILWLHGLGHSLVNGEFSSVDEAEEHAKSCIKFGRWEILQVVREGIVSREVRE